MSIPTDLGDALIAVPARIRFALARLQLSRAVYKLPAAQITSKTGSQNLKLFGACQNFSCITGNSGNNLVVHEKSGLRAPEVTLNSVCDHPAAAGIYPQSALALRPFA